MARIITQPRVFLPYLHFTNVLTKGFHSKRRATDLTTALIGVGVFIYIVIYVLPNEFLMKLTGFQKKLVGQNAKI